MHLTVVLLSIIGGCELIHISVPKSTDKYNNYAENVRHHGKKKLVAGTIRRPGFENSCPRPNLFDISKNFGLVLVPEKCLYNRSDLKSICKDEILKSLNLLS